MEALGIDFKLLVAQIVNFGLVVLILSKLVYKPIIKLLDDRKKTIEDTIEKSKAIEERLTTLEDKEKSVLSKARDKGNQEREDIVKLANDEKRQILDEAKVASEKEIEKGLARIKAAEEEASFRIKEKFSEEIVGEVIKKLTDSSKAKGGFPLLKKILE